MRKESTKQARAADPRLRPPGVAPAGIASAEPSDVIGAPRESADRANWIVELWWENRETFKEMVKHILWFGIFLGSLELFHFLLKLSSLTPEQKYIIDKVDFYMVVIALGLFGAGFIIKLTIFEVRGMRK